MHDRLFSGLRFTATAKLIVQVASWLGTLYVLRELDSHALGVFGIASAVLGYATMVYEGGLLEALVQRPPVNTAERRAAFSLLTLTGVGLAALIAVVAPLVGRLVGDPLVAPMTMSMGLGVLLVPVGILSQSRLMNEMRFDRLALIASAQAVVSTGATVALARAGYGAWSLAAGFVFGVGLRSVLLLWASPPQARFTFRLRPAFRYLDTGGVLIVDGLLWRWYTSLDSILLGRWAGTVALGNFSFAQQVSNTPLEKITTVVNDISLPAYVAIEHDREEARRLMLELMRTHAMIGFPMFWGLAAVAQPAIVTLFGDKWLPATWCLVALSLIAPLRLIGSVETPAMTGIGRPKLLLKSKAIVVPIMTVAIVAGAWWKGVDGVAWAWLLAFPLSYGVAFRFVLAAIGLSYAQVTSVVRGPLLAAAGMALLAYGTTLLFGASTSVVQLVVGIAVGACAYAALLWRLDRHGLYATLARLRRLAGLAPRTVGGPA